MLFKSKHRIVPIEYHVSNLYKQIAREEGLNMPLTGLDDPRLREPDNLVLNKEWTFTADSQSKYYRFYNKKGQIIQEYVLDGTNKHLSTTRWEKITKYGEPCYVYTSESIKEHYYNDKVNVCRYYNHYEPSGEEIRNIQSARFLRKFLG